MVTVNLIAGCPTPPECLVVFHFNKLSKLGRVLREHIKFVWTGGTNSNADTCHFFFFLRRAIYTQMQRVIATNGSRGKRRKGHRPPNRRLSEHTGVDALESNTQSQVQRESDHKKKKSQSSGFTVLDESHTLGLFRDLSLSRAAQGCRAGCRTVGQYNTSEAH